MLTYNAFFVEGGESLQQFIDGLSRLTAENSSAQHSVNEMNYEQKMK